MRVLVVRPRAEADETASRLRDIGHEPLVAPILEIVATGLACPNLEVAAVLATSRHAIPAAAAVEPGLALLPWHVVGDRTAATVRAAGFRVTSAASTGADLAREITGRYRAGTRLLHVCGRDRSREPGTSLAEAGMVVHRWDVYEARQVDHLPALIATALSEGRLDAACHYSPRSARTLVALAEAAGLTAELARLSHLCLSAAVAGEIAVLTGPRVIVSATPDVKQ